MSQDLLISIWPWTIPDPIHWLLKLMSVIPPCGKLGGAPTTQTLLSGRSCLWVTAPSVSASAEKPPPPRQPIAGDRGRWGGSVKGHEGLDILAWRGQSHRKHWMPTCFAVGFLPLSSPASFFLPLQLLPLINGFHPGLLLSTASGELSLGRAVWDHVATGGWGLLSSLFERADPGGCPLPGTVVVAHGDQGNFVSKGILKNFFHLVLLSYNWHSTIYRFKVYSIMIWLTCIVKLLPQ